MEYYCHKPASQKEYIASINQLNKLGCSVEPAEIDGVVYLKVTCPEGTTETYVGNNALPDYRVACPAGEFYVRKMFHRGPLMESQYQCVLYIAPEGNNADT